MKLSDISRAVSLLLVTAMIAPLASCGEQPIDDSTVTTTADGDDTIETTEADSDVSPLYEMEQKDYGGREFRISVSEKYTDEMWVEEETGDVCNDAVYNRNLKVEDYFNVKIVPVITPSATNESQVDMITKTLLAGEDAFDLTAVYTYLAGGPALEGLYHSWDNVPGVDLTREWWIQSANEAFTINGKQYVAVGDLSITTLLLSYAVFFNQRLAENYQFPNLYQTVLDGDWTIDMLIEYSKDLYQDLNNDGKTDQNDAYGFAADNVTNLDAYTAAFDIPLTEKDPNGYPVACVDLDRLQTAAEKVYSLYYDTPSYIGYGSGDEITVFANGNTAFLTTWINNSFSTLRDMQDDYGILPYPKLDENQEHYYSNSMDNYSLLSVPKTVKDLEFVGTVTEAMTRESSYSVVPAYYDVALTSKYARDEESVAMLDIIMDGRQYDFSILHSDQIARLPYFFRELIAAKSTNVASKYAAIESQIDEGLKALGDSYSELGD